MLKISPEEFWDLEPRELQLAAQGYNKEREMGHRVSWEQTRWHATALYNLQVKNPIRATDLVKFPWDKKNDTPVRLHTPEELEALKKRFNVSDKPDQDKLKAFKERLAKQLAVKNKQ